MASGALIFLGHLFDRFKLESRQFATLFGCGTANYGYDANGNMTTAQGNGNSQAAQDVGQLALKYDPYNKPFFIERNGKRSEFWYGPDDQRYFQLENGNQRTVYIDKLYEQIGSTIHKLYLGDYAVFTVDVTSAADSGINYLHKDRLGSIVSITDESGNLIANAGRSFGPFGKPREEDLADSDGLTSSLMPYDGMGDLNREDITTRGFTGHEQLNNLSLTHMNGRVYDYNLGRFLGVDPIIAFPENSQSLNPYSYILNNPLSGTDPTGYVPTCRDDPSLCGRDVVGGTSFDCQRGANCDSLILSGNVDNGLNDDNVKSVLVAGDVSTLEGPENISVNNIDLIEGDDGRHTVLITIGGTENKDLLPVVTHYARDGVVSVLPGLPTNLASVRTHDVPRWLLAPESFERPRSGTAGNVLEAAVGLTGVGGFALGGYELFTGTSLFTGAKVSRILAGVSFIPFTRAFRAAKSVGRAISGGDNLVYQSVNHTDGVIQYVGITNNIERRAAEHFRSKGIQVDAIPGLTMLSRSDARAVEQVLIERFGLRKNGGTLLNKINSVSPRNSIYVGAISRGNSLLRQVGYPGF